MCDVYAKILLDSLGHYSARKYTDDNLGTLAFFLADIGRFAHDIKDWIINEKNGATSTNAHWISKNDSLITLGYLYEEREGFEYDFSREQFLSILDQWEDLYNKKAKEIWIYKEGDKIWLEGKN